ncbi:MAG: hypothetical protein DELT_01553 [Desulfovibrio sp.]
MVGMKFGDPHAIVTSLLTDYVQKELAKGSGNKTAESLASTLAGVRISRQYRRDIPESDRNVIAREFLRGILADHTVY